MAIINATVGNPATTSNTDGTSPGAMGGKAGELLISPLYGENYTLAYRGAVFHLSTTPLGLAIPIYTSGTPTVALWNPAGSGKNAVLLSYSIAYASGTAEYAAVGLMKETSAGSAVATGAVFSAFTDAVVPTNGLIGGGSATAMKASAGGTNTITTIGVALRWFYTMAGINLEAQTATAHGTVLGVQKFNGEVIVTPGTAIWAATSRASVALYAQTISWAEVPI